MKFVQVYCTSFGLSRCHPIKKKSESQETLSLMFKCDGVPLRTIVENPKEQSLAEFEHNCREVDCHLVNNEPYSPWQQASGGCIKKLKKSSSRKLISSGAPKKLLDHCIELIAFIRSHTAHIAYELQDEFPETVITGQTADISNICDYDWYEWVMFLDNITSYPEDRHTLGRYIGHVIDVRSSLCYKVLKADRNISCQTMSGILP